MVHTCDSSLNYDHSSSRSTSTVYIAFVCSGHKGGAMGVGVWILTFPSSAFACVVCECSVDKYS